MKLRSLLLMVLAIVVLVGSLLAPRCQAETLIDFTDYDTSGSLSYQSGSGLNATYSSWTQTVTTTNTAVGAIVSKIGPAGAGMWHAWLMNQVGPSTTTANQIATTEFSAPYISEWGDLTTAPYTTLFTGLSLSPGTYYLVLQGPALINNTLQGGWLGDRVNVGVNTGTDFMVMHYGYANKSSLANYVPASDFSIVSDSASYLFYRVDTTPVPLPPSVYLFGSGLVGLIGLRRFRRS